VADTRVTTTVRLPKSLHKKLKIRSIEEERSMEAILADACAQLLTKGGKRVR
jgi:plasmid stability protein